MFRFFKLAVISFIIFFIFLYLMSLLIPSQVRISRAINIEAPPETVLPLIADTANWKQWNDMSSGTIDITIVQWYFDFRLRWYPWEKFGSITFDKQFGTSMESSLNNLKKVITNSP